MRSARFAVSLLLIVSVALVPRSARPATSTTTMSISATVFALCTIAATPMAFATYAPSAASSNTATLTVICTTASPFNVGLDAGTTTGSTVTNRRMTNGSSFLNYKLTSDAAHNVNIGTTIGTDTLTGTGTGLAQILTVYGIVAAGQNVSAGIYSDLVTATITY